MAQHWSGHTGSEFVDVVRVEAPHVRLTGSLRGTAWVWEARADGREVFIAYSGSSATLAAELADALFPAVEKTPEQVKETMFTVIDSQTGTLKAVRLSLVAAIDHTRSGDLVFRGSGGGELLRINGIDARMNKHQILALHQRWRMLFGCADASPGARIEGSPTPTPTATETMDAARAAHAELSRIVAENATDVEHAEPLTEEQAQEIRDLLKEAGALMPDAVLTKPQGEES